MWSKLVESEIIKISWSQMEEGSEFQVKNVSGYFASNRKLWNLNLLCVYLEIFKAGSVHDQNWLLEYSKATYKSQQGEI